MQLFASLRCCTNVRLGFTTHKKTGGLLYSLPPAYSWSEVVGHDAPHGGTQTCGITPSGDTVVSATAAMGGAQCFTA